MDGLFDQLDDMTSKTNKLAPKFKIAISTYQVNTAGNSNQKIYFKMYK